MAGSLRNVAATRPPVVPHPRSAPRAAQQREPARLTGRSAAKHPFPLLLLAIAGLLGGAPAQADPAPQPTQLGAPQPDSPAAPQPPLLLSPELVRPQLAPPPPLPARSPSPATTSGAVPTPLEIELTANQQSYDVRSNRVVAVGNVMARVAGGRLLADRLEYDTESRTVYAAGSVRFQRGMQYLQASRLRYSLLEGTGEMEDVYGVLDLDGAAQDFDPNAVPSAALPAVEPISCTPALPTPPQWHPYPWAVTAWGGQMFAANFGDTFLFKGKFRPEYLGGLGLQRRLLDAGPLAIEIDANLLGHHAAKQPGGEFNQAIPFADTPAQTFADGTIGLGMRVWLQPWLSLYFVEGVSLLSENSNYERTYRQNYTQFLNYLAFEVEALFNPQWSAVGRIHHRSGAYGTYSGVSEGSNAYLLGLRYRFGQPTPVRVPLQLPPAQGCAGAPAPGGEPPRGLMRQLEQVTMGPGLSTSRDPLPPGSARGGGPQPQPAPRPRRGSSWDQAAAQERRRDEAISRINQRVENVSFEQSLIAERRRGFPTEFNTPDTVNQFGTVRPSQLNDLGTAGNRQLLRGTISRWRLQARSLRFTPTTLEGDRVGFSNDPFTPAQSWLDSENVVARLMPNGDTVIKAARNHLRLEDRLPIPVSRQTRIKKQEEVDNRWVLGNDQKDRDGSYLGYNIPIQIDKQRLLTLQPQFMLQRAIEGSTDSFPPPGSAAGSSTVTQPASTSDLFGLMAKLEGPLLGFSTDARLDIYTFNPDNFANGFRSWGNLARPVKLPVLGDSIARVFGAYRFRTWNGSLGEEDVYAAYGVSLEDTGVLPNWGQLSRNYYWRIGFGNFKGNQFTTDNLADYWRGNAIGSMNFSLPLWTGKALAATPDQALVNSAVPIVPGLTLNANLLGTLAYYGTGNNQNTLTLSGGPTLTLGHFQKPFLDYTQLTVTGGGTLRQGISPLSFDRAVDLGTINIGLTQQIVGPLVFSGGIGFNVDPNSGNYGDVTNSYLEVRWQRRAYEVGLFYSPYQGLGGLRVKLNDFNFNGSGTPFVPYDPARLDPQQQQLRRPF